MGVSPDIFSSAGTYISKIDQGSPFLMMTTGEGLVVAACPELYQWSQDHLSSLSYGEAFEAFWMAEIHETLRAVVGARFGGPERVFFCPDQELCISDPPIDLKVESITGDQINQKVNVRDFETGLQSVHDHSIFEAVAVDGDVIGVCGGTPNPDKLISLYIEILPQWQGKGIGVWLTSHTINTLRERGYHVYCRNSIGNIKSTRAANNLGLRLGWLEVRASMD